MKKIILATAFLFVAIFPFTISPVEAQFQSEEFSGSNPGSYQCLTENSGTKDLIESWTEAKAAQPILLFWVNPQTPPVLASGRFRCPDGSEAILKPPTLQQIEIWFVRILYVVWAVVASLSFYYLIVLGYRYMISQGDVTKITEIRQKIIYYIIGFILIFLAIPILTTVFRLLGINDQVQCYNVNMPGFQFFFTDLCSAVSSDSPLLDQYCAEGRDITGLACGVLNDRYTCGSVNYVCSTGSGGTTSNIWVIR